MKTKQARNKNSSKGKAIFGGILISVLSLVSVIAVGSLLILMTKDPLSNSDRFSPLCYAVAGLLSGRIGKRLITEGRLFLFCPPLVVLSLLLLGLFLNGGIVPPSALFSEMLFLLSSYLAFFLHKRHHVKKGARRR